jgi:PAS domain S-box-containing protein
VNVEVLQRENDRLRQENASLQSGLHEIRTQLAEPEDLIRAIRSGEVDALVVQENGHEEIYSLLRFDSVYRTVVEECFPYGVWLAETDGRLLYVTPAFLASIDVDFEELKAKGQFYFLPDGVRESVEAVWRQSRETSTPFNVEYQVRLADGSQRVIWTHGRRVRTHDGRPHWVGVNIDVTERQRTKEELQTRTSALQEKTAELERINNVLACEMHKHQEVARALSESEARLRAILDNTSAIIYLVDRENRLLHINRRWLDVFGVTNEQVVGRSLYELFPKEVADQFSQNNRKTLESGSPLEVEEVVQHSDGPHTYITVKVPIVDASGAPYAICGISTDITERKRIESERIQALATLNSLIASAPVGIAFFDRDMRYQLVNEPLAAMNGVPCSHHIGRTVKDIIPDLIPQIEPSLKAVLECQTPIVDQIIEGERPSAPGVKRAWRQSWFPVSDSCGQPAGVGVFVQEVTEQRQAEERLRHKNERLALLAEASAVLLQADDPNAMLSEIFVKIAPHLSLDAYCFFIARGVAGALQLASHSGIDNEQVASFCQCDLQQGISGAVAGSRQPMVVNHVQQSDDPKAALVKADGVRAVYATPLIGRDRLHGTLLFCSRTRDEFDDKEIEFLQTISLYVTAAYERVSLITQLREADRRKDDFLATLGHELRNPLAPIRNGLELIRRSDGNNEVLLEAQNLMDRQLQRMVRLIDDLLDISRVASGKVQIRKVRVDLATILRSAIEAARPLVEAKRHELSLALPTEPVYLHADPTRLAQVFANLLDNATKYTEPGGRIWLTAECRHGRAIVSVRDTGIGISAEGLARVFERFSQMPAAIEHSRGGLGIGLSLVKGLVELHSGTIVAHSDGIGRGSQFTVELPVAEASPSAPQQNNEFRVPSSSTGPRRRILVVDDNRDSADSLAMLLRFKGHEVSTAYDGIEAVQAAAAARPDVVLLDIGLPRLNGYEVARRIRNEPWGAKTALIAMTGWGQEDDKRRALEAGCDHHLTKPVAPAVLEKLLALIGSSSAHH